MSHVAFKYEWAVKEGVHDWLLHITAPVSLMAKLPDALKTAACRPRRRSESSARWAMSRRNWDAFIPGAHDHNKQPSSFVTPTSSIMPFRTPHSLMFDMMPYSITACLWHYWRWYGDVQTWVYVNTYMLTNESVWEHVCVYICTYRWNTCVRLWVNNGYVYTYVYICVCPYRGGDIFALLFCVCVREREYVFCAGTTNPTWV